MVKKRYLYAARTTGDVGRILNRLGEKGIKAEVSLMDIGVTPQYPQVIIVKMDLEKEKKERAIEIMDKLMNNRIAQLI